MEAITRETILYVYSVSVEKRVIGIEYIKNGEKEEDDDRLDFTPVYALLAFQSRAIRLQDPLHLSSVVLHLRLRNVDVHFHGVD